MAKSDDTQAEAVIAGVAQQKRQILQILLRQEGDGRSANEVYNMSDAELRAAVADDGVIDRGEVVDAYSQLRGVSAEKAEEALEGKDATAAWESTWDDGWKRGTWALTGNADEDYDGDNLPLDDFVRHRSAEVWHVERSQIDEQLNEQDPAAGTLYDPSDLTDAEIGARVKELGDYATSNGGSLDAPYSGPRTLQDPMSPLVGNRPGGGPVGGSPSDPPGGGEGATGSGPPGGSDPDPGGGLDSEPGEPLGTPGGSQGGGGDQSTGGGGDDDSGSGGPPPGSTRYSHATVPGVAAEQGYRDENGNWYEPDGTPMETEKAERMEEAKEKNETQQLDTIPADEEESTEEEETPDVDTSVDPTGDNYQPTEEDLEASQEYYDLIRAGRTPIDPARDSYGEPTGDPMWTVRPGVDQPGPFGRPTGGNGDGELSGTMGPDPTHTDPVDDDDFGGGAGPYQDDEIADLLQGDPDLSDQVPGTSSSDGGGQSEATDAMASEPVDAGTSGFQLVAAPFQGQPDQATPIDESKVTGGDVAPRGTVEVDENLVPNVNSGVAGRQVPADDDFGVGSPIDAAASRGAVGETTDAGGTQAEVAYVAEVAEVDYEVAAPEEPDASRVIDTDLDEATTDLLGDAVADQAPPTRGVDDSQDLDPFD